MFKNFRSKENKTMETPTYVVWGEGMCGFQLAQRAKYIVIKQET